MNKAILFLSIVFLNAGSLLPLAAQTTQTPQADNRQEVFLHTVESGQTAYAIATMYGVSQDELYRLNPGSREGIKAGVVLKIPQKAADNYTYHTIQAGETLYSITLKYEVQAERIIEANTGLSASTFTTGKIIRIPNARKGEVKTVVPPIPSSPVPSSPVPSSAQPATYTVQRGETVYSLSHRFNISPAELLKLNPALKKELKAGMVLKLSAGAGNAVKADVPKQPKAPVEKEVNALLTADKQIKKVEPPLKVVLLLPFSSKQTAAVSRFVEYYEGLLIAVDSMRNRGASLELSVFDTGDGTQQLEQILKDKVLLKADLIIGGVQNEQVALIAVFAQQHTIKYVIPFNSLNDDVLSNRNVYQVNTPHSYLYSKAAQGGCSLFAKDNIVIVRIQDDKEKGDFIRTFKEEMDIKHIHYKEIPFRQETFVPDVKAAFDPQKRNIVLPTSSSLDALDKIRNPLRMLTNSIGSAGYNICLFGYPDWQTYLREALDDFYAMNTYIYSNFYADNLSPAVQQFYTEYKDWYSKNLINIFPKYGILGFDTGMYFFEAMKKYGSNFENNLDKINYHSLQTDFAFKPVSNWGGFININVFIVQYRDDFTVTRNKIH
ncbi:Muramidase-2 precursor [Bacteroidales bacterium Barb4]|nr:Muramidase-2 precursor [Bacteroidales bacterium Barb4]